MRRSVSPHIGVKAAGGVRTLDALLEVMALGVTRVGATATKTMLDEFRSRKVGRCRARRRPPPAAPAAGDTEVTGHGRDRYSRHGVHRRGPLRSGLRHVPAAPGSGQRLAGGERGASRSRPLRLSSGRTTRWTRSAPTRRSTSSWSRSRTSSTSRRCTRRGRHGKGVACHEAARPERDGGRRDGRRGHEAGDFHGYLENVVFSPEIMRMREMVVSGCARRAC